MGFMEGWRKSTQASQDEERLKEGKYVPSRDPEAIEQKRILLDALSQGDLSVIDSIPSDRVPVILKKNETCYTCIKGAQLWEDRAVRTSTGGYGGPRIRVAKGVSFGLGGFGAQSTSHDERTHIDTGVLLITNKRVIFTGKGKTIEFALNKVLAVDSIPLEGIKVNRSNKQKVEYYLGGFDGDTVTAAMKGLIKNLSK